MNYDEILVYSMCLNTYLVQEDNDENFTSKILNLRLVCKTYKEIIDNFIQGKYFLFPSIKKYNCDISNFPFTNYVTTNSKKKEIFSRCDRLDLSNSKISKLDKFSSAKKIDISNCNCLKSFKGLEFVNDIKARNNNFTMIDVTLKFVVNLDLSGCIYLTDISLLRFSDFLLEVNLSKTKIREIKSIRKCVMINISYCEFIGNINRDLQDSSVRDLCCNGIQNLKELEVPRGLESLSVCGCKNLVELKYDGLKILNYNGCDGLKITDKSLVILIR